MTNNSTTPTPNQTSGSLQSSPSICSLQSTLLIPRCVTSFSLGTPGCRRHHHHRCRVHQWTLIVRWLLSVRLNGGEIYFLLSVSLRSVELQIQKYHPLLLKNKDHSPLSPEKTNKTLFPGKSGLFSEQSRSGSIEGGFGAEAECSLLGWEGRDCRSQRWAEIGEEIILDGVCGQNLKGPLCHAKELRIYSPCIREQPGMLNGNRNNQIYRFERVPRKGWSWNNLVYT